MSINIKPKDLVNMAVLKRKIAWPHIDEEGADYGEPVFVIRPGREGGRSIRLHTDEDYDGFHYGTFGPAHWHFHDIGYGEGSEWRDTWGAIKLARDLVAGRVYVLESRRDTGQIMSCQLLKSGIWPDLIYRHECLPADGDHPGLLLYPSGERWRPPFFRLYYFDRPPYDDQPDWNSYLPVPEGWARPAKRG